MGRLLRFEPRPADVIRVRCPILNRAAIAIKDCPAKLQVTLLNLVF